MDLYQILEIKPTASKLDIKKAYFKLAKKYHPDKNNGINNTEKFQKIKAAYDILINDDTRQEYYMMNEDDKMSFTEILEKILKDKKSFFYLHLAQKN
jgi:curved DNA-binding protein CbpA